MKNNIIKSLAAIALLSTACDYNEEYFEGLDEMAQTTDVQSVEYTLTADDYATLAKIDSLSYLSSTMCFRSAEGARAALAEFVADKYYMLDNKSAVKVTYNIAAADAVVAGVASATQYELADADYATAWGSDKAAYLTPATVGSMPAVLKGAIADAQAGDYAVVSYQFSANEPSTGNSEDVVAAVSNWEKVSAALPTSDSWNFIGSGNVDLTPYIGKRVRIALRYTSTSEKAGTAEAKNFMVAEAGYVYPTLFTEQADGSFASSTKVSEGKALLLAKVGDEYFSFSELKDPSKTYGYCTSEAVAVVDGVVAADAAAAHTVTIEAGATEGAYYIKANSGKYFYMSGTYNSFNVVDEVPAEVGENGYEWSISATANAVFVTNVVKAKTVAYDTNYNSFGSYDEAKLGVYYNEPLTGLDAFPEGFETVNIVMPEAATYIWSYASNYGSKASAYISKVNYESDSWLILPEVDLTEATAPYFAMDVCGNYFGGNMAEYFGVYVSTDYTEGSDFVVAGNKSALKAAEAATETIFGVYTFDGSAWKESTDVIIVNPADYKAMGSNYSNFGTSMAPADYLPKFLSVKYPYAKADDEVTVAYHYYANSTTSVMADKYKFADGVWAIVPGEAATEQYVKSSNTWNWDPSLTITLTYGKSIPFSALYYQTMVDWILENVENGASYVTSYGNNDYYFGSSAYQNNFDFRPAKWREQYADGYVDYTDEELLDLMWNVRLPQALEIAIEALNPSIAPVEGVNVTVTIIFGVYDGSTTKYYEAVFAVVGAGDVELVEGSIKLHE